MIIVYPMMTSESVNPAILPGLMKTVEKYIIVNNINDVLDHANNNMAKFAKDAGQLTVAAGITSMMSKRSRIVKKGKTLRLIEKSTKDNVKGAVSDSLKDSAKELASAKKDAAIKSFDMPRYDNISLEPSWIQVNTSAGAKLLGVKVIPFKVKSTNGMVGLLMDDHELNSLTYMASKLERKILRVFYRAMRGMKIPGFGGGVVTGDPVNDIVLATSKYGKNIFVCFSQLDIEKEDVFTSPEAVHRLHELGWASLIISDDVNKQATFCMKEFGGVCSTIPYSNIFASLGSEQHKVYKDFEDAQRSAGPFFRRKRVTKRKYFLSKK